MTALLEVYPRLPLTLVGARGTELFTEDGRRILDLYGGHAVCPLGHAHPELTDALTRAHRTLDFFSNSVLLPMQERAAKAVLGESEHLTRVHFLSSGTEANEAAIHLARKATGRTTIVTFTNSFHGRTLGSLSVTGLPGYHKLLKVPEDPRWNRNIGFGSFEDLERVDETVAAVLCESVPSLGGIYMPPEGYYQAVARRCAEVGAVLIFDEVQGGVGRLGRWFAHERFGVKPDLVTLAKSLGGGFPVSAMVATEAMAAHATSGELGTTFGGGPMACAMVETVARILRRDGWIERTEAIFQRIADGLSGLDGVEVRGAGCLIGIQSPLPARTVRDRLLEHDVMVGLSGEPNTLRLLPPYIVTDAEIDRFVALYREAIDG